MKNKFYVYVSSGKRIAVQLLVMAVTIALVIILIAMEGADDSFTFVFPLVFVGALFICTFL